jgi:predicted  nucleic acid-binding Zn-ribbon protein
VDTKLQTLIKLQEVDRVILDIQQKIDEYPKIMHQLDKQLSDSEHNIEQLQVSIEEQEKIRRSKERDIETNIEQIKKYQGQLLQVKTNKEYSALLMEIKGLKAKNSLTEDDILELMESIERARIALASSQQELGQIRTRVQQEKQQKEAEEVDIQQLLEQDQQKRATLTKNIEKNIMKEYTKLFNLRNGLAVTPVEEGGVCKGCHVALTPQMFAEVKTGKYLHRCPTCSRFLYWLDSDAQQEEK